MPQTETQTSHNAYEHGAAYVDGDYCPLGEARIPLNDLGFTRSDCTYDVAHVWNGRFFRLDDHLERFARSCAKLRLKLPCDTAGLAEIMNEMVSLTGYREAYVSITASRGPLPPGTRNPLECRNRLYGFVTPFVWITSPEEQKTGVDMIIASTQRTPMESFDASIKNYQWGDFTRSLMETADAGARIPSLVDQEGNITEGPGFNIFILRGGTLMTAETGVLQGITRKTVLELAGRLNIETQIAPTPVDHLRQADEVFVCSTAGGIMPVCSVDGEPVGDGAPGPVSQRIHEMYWELHADPDYSTAVRHAG